MAGCVRINCLQLSAQLDKHVREPSGQKEQVGEHRAGMATMVVCMGWVFLSMNLNELQAMRYTVGGKDTAVKVTLLAALRNLCKVPHDCFSFAKLCPLMQKQQAPCPASDNCNKCQHSL